MTKDFKEGYNFALDEIYNFINWITTSNETLTFRINNGSKGVKDEILTYLIDRRKK